MYLYERGLRVITRLTWLKGVGVQEHLHNTNHARSEMEECIQIWAANTPCSLPLSSGYTPCQRQMRVSDWADTEQCLCCFCCRKAKGEELPDQAPPTEPRSASPALPITSTDPPTSTTCEAPPTSTPALPSTPAPPSSLVSSTPTPPPAFPGSTPLSTAPSKNIKKKFGDFFAFKKVRAGRGSKGDGGSEVKAKKTSIADLIRPLREAARAEKEKEKERERGKAEEAGVNHSDATVTEGGGSEDKMAPAAPLPDGPAPSAPPGDWGSGAYWNHHGLTGNIPPNNHCRH